MAEITEISWCDHTANLWWGCQKVHAGCDHCYAEAWAQRWGNDIWGPRAPRRAIKAVWSDLAHFQREAAKAQTVRRVFVGSMMDIFEKPYRVVDAKGLPMLGNTGMLRERLFRDVIPASANLDFLLLTKRPSLILPAIPEDWKTTPRPNVLYGASVVNQPTVEQLVPELLRVPGRHFLSMEPLLGPVDLTPYLQTNQIHWVIVGGESGPGARPMNPEWALALKEQCERAGVPFHFKQTGVPLAKQLGLTHHKGGVLDELPPVFQKREFPLPL